MKRIISIATIIIAIAVGFSSHYFWDLYKKETGEVESEDHKIQETWAEEGELVEVESLCTIKITDVKLRKAEAVYNAYPETPPYIIMTIHAEINNISGKHQYLLDKIGMTLFDKEDQTKYTGGHNITFPHLPKTIYQNKFHFKIPIIKADYVLAIYSLEEGKYEELTFVNLRDVKPRIDEIKYEIPFEAKKYEIEAKKRKLKAKKQKLKKEKSYKESMIKLESSGLEKLDREHDFSLSLNKSTLNRLTEKGINTECRITKNLLKSIDLDRLEKEHNNRKRAIQERIKLRKQKLDEIHLMIKEVDEDIAKTLKELDELKELYRNKISQI